MSPDQQYLDRMKEQLLLISQDRSTKSTLVDFLENVVGALQSEPQRKEVIQIINNYIRQYRLEGDMTGC
ncbi:MAG TPA: hypothetical protein VMZ91_07245 [Candidatus Paceibacterota bacterium]|nr:hypothetical protein [Candidatus Paceibacterota bacterium]